MSQLHAAFANAIDGTGSMLALSGDAGMGKTTLVEDFLLEIQPHTTWIARGCCSERLANTDAFIPIFECLDELIRGEAGEEAMLMMRTEAPAWLAQIVSAGDSAAISARTAVAVSRERMRREFVHFFEALSCVRPVIIFLDDVHWADASSCDLVAYLVSRMRANRLLVIAAYRPSELMSASQPFLPIRIALERGGECREIPLQFLALDDIERYLQLNFPANNFPPEFTSIVEERTEGHPLFLADLLRFFRDKGVVTEQDGHWIVKETLEQVRKMIPRGTESMIRLQIAQFSELDRKILQCAAVQGVQFDSAVVSQALSLDPVEVEDRLQSLEGVHHFVRFGSETVFSECTVSSRYRFLHVFYQNVLFAKLTPTRRGILSLAVAQALVALTDNTTRAIAAEVALLFESGQDHENASTYFLYAARNAASVFAYPEAVILCERGLRELLSLPESRERDSRELVLSLMLGMTQMATCGYAAPEVETTHQRSRELCLRLNEKRRLVPVLWGLHTCHVNAGELVPALELAREMRQVADTLTNPTAIVASLHALGTTLAFMGKLVDARDALEKIFEIIPIRQRELQGSLYVLDPCVTSMSMLARLLALMGFLDEAVEKAAASVSIANQLIHPPSVAYSTFWVGWIRHARGDHDEACRQLVGAMDLSCTYDLPQVLEWSRVVHGSSLAHLGAVSEGIAEMRKSLENQRAMRCFVERSYCLTLLAEALLSAKDGEGALKLCDEALAFGRKTEGRSYEAETYRVRGEALLALGYDAPSPGESDFECALEIACGEKCRLLELRAAMSKYRLLRKGGDGPRERAALAELAAWFSHSGSSPVVSEAQRLLAE